MTRRKLLSRLALIWLIPVATALFFIQSVLFGLSAFYHPHADGSHFAAQRTEIAGVTTIGAVLLAFSLSFIVRRMTLPRIFALWGAVALLTTGALAIGKSRIAPQPDIYAHIVNGVRYAVPRHFSPGPAVVESSFTAQMCWSTGKGIYAGPCPKEEGMPRHVNFDLSEGYVTDYFGPRFALDEMGATHDADRLTDFGTPALPVRDVGGGLRMFGNGDRGQFFFVDSSDRLVGAVFWKTSGPWYEIFEQTGMGLLRFDTKSDTPPMPESWAAHGAHIRSLLAAWR